MFERIQRCAYDIGLTLFDYNMNSKVKRVIHVSPPQVRYEIKEKHDFAPENKFPRISHNKLKTFDIPLPTKIPSPSIREDQISSRTPLKLAGHTKSALDLISKKTSTPNRVYFEHPSKSSSYQRLRRRPPNFRLIKYPSKFSLLKQKSYFGMKPFPVTPLRMELINAIKSSIDQHQIKAQAGRMT